MPVSLVPLRWWHIERIVPLERGLFGPSAWTAETFWSELAHPENRHYLVAVESGSDGGGTPARDDGVAPVRGGAGAPSEDAAPGRILGYAGVMVNASEADVQTIAVAPQAAGQGLGGRLLDALVEAAVRRGATGMMLEVRGDNLPAVRLYTGRGFERIAIRRGYYQPEGADAWVMRRRPLRGPARAGRAPAAGPHGREGDGPGPDGRDRDERGQGEERA